MVVCGMRRVRKKKLKEETKAKMGKERRKSGIGALRHEEYG